MEHPRLKLVPIWDVDATGGSLAYLVYYAMVQAPILISFVFLSEEHTQSPRLLIFIRAS